MCCANWVYLVLANIKKKMKIYLIVLCAIVFQFSFSQQYDSVIIENDNIDSNNRIYKPGNVFVYNYEIIQNDKSYKLKNNGRKLNREKMIRESDFKLSPKNSDSIAVEKIHLIVQPVSNEIRTNENQTQISYIQDPLFDSFSSTGAVENESNVWIHPIRAGFFNSLETAPFPFAKMPLKIGLEWHDQMLIGENWGNELWGKWPGSLLLTYDYKVTDKKSIKSEIGNIECYIIESTAKSSIGTTKLTSYFSERYGFVKLNYELLNGLNVNFWLIEYKTGKEFNDLQTFFKTKQYIKQ